MPIKHILFGEREREEREEEREGEGEREAGSGFHRSHLAVGGGLKPLPLSSPVTETVDDTDSTHKHSTHMRLYLT